jgi:hypothetical protein
VSVRRAAALVALLLAAGCAGSTEPPRAAAAAKAPAGAVIQLPEMLAVELPAPGMASIAPDASPIRELLGAASAGGAQVTHDRLDPLLPGPTRVTWTAWEGAPRQSAVRATRTEYVYVFPYGQTPVGVSGDDHATAANRAPKVVRDASGALHMAWLDSGRPGVSSRVMYRHARPDAQTGVLAWSGEALHISAPPAEGRHSYVAVEASPRAVHFAWAAGESVFYRRLANVNGTWTWGDIRHTGIAGRGHDASPDIAVRGDDEIHLLSVNGRYGVSTDGGRSWRLDQVPRPAGLKNPSLAVDAQGNAHVAFTALVRSAPNFSSSKPSGGYWQLRYVRRQATGGWVDAQDVLAESPEWGDPRAQTDVLVDWCDIAVDGSGALHVAFHGTANTGIYGNDEAFVVRRAATGPGAWSRWERPQPLHPIKADAAHFFSYAPSISVDPTGDAIVSVVFFGVAPDGRYVFDTAARLLRAGRLVGPPIPLSGLARAAFTGGQPQEAPSVWFPVAAPRLHRGSDGRVWLDVLQTVATPSRQRSVHYVVYQRRELTELFR